MKNRLNFYRSLLMSDIHSIVGTLVFEDIIKHDRERLYDKYKKVDRLIRLYDYLIDNGLDEFDWKFIIERGLFCKNDFEMFKDELEKEGYTSYEDACKIYEQWRDNEIQKETSNN